MDECLGWMPMTLASCRAARASWVPPGSPCCAPGSHHLVPTTHSGHDQPDKGHFGGGQGRGQDINSRMWERKEGQGGDEGEEEDAEKRRKKGKQGAE